MNNVFILVNPAVPENIGASARAIKTMGFSELRLVNPCNHLSDKSLMLAHGSHEILENAKLFKSLYDAVFDIDLKVGTTARHRSVKVDYTSIDQLPGLIEQKKDFVKNVGIIFGCEESGLSNEDILLCDIISYIPLIQNYPSLNLSQAVMIYAYVLSKSNLNAKNLIFESPNTGSLQVLKKKLDNVLLMAGIDKESVIYGRIIERFMLLGNDDLNLAHSLLTRLLEKAKF